MFKLCFEVFFLRLKISISQTVGFIKILLSINSKFTSNAICKNAATTNEKPASINPAVILYKGGKGILRYRKAGYKVTSKSGIKVTISNGFKDST